MAHELCNNAQVQWDDLRYVLALRRAQTLSGASRELSVKHTTVARRVAALEEVLGTRLFDKTPSGYVPTPAGEDVLVVAEQVEQQMQVLDRRVLGQDARLSGPLRITTVDLLAIEHAREFTDFAERYPAVSLDVSVDNRLLSLTRREADVAIRVTPAPPEHLVGRRLGHVEFAVYGACSLIDASLDPTNLEAYRWLRWDERLDGKLTREWRRRHVSNAAPGICVDSVLSMLSVVEAGAGVCHLPCIYADRRPALRRVRDIEPNFGTDLWLLTHPDLRHTARVRAFIDHMVGAFAKLADAMRGDRAQHPAVTSPTASRG